MHHTHTTDARSRPPNRHTQYTFTQTITFTISDRICVNTNNQIFGIRYTHHMHRHTRFRITPTIPRTIPPATQVTPTSHTFTQHPNTLNLYAVSQYSKFLKKTKFCVSIESTFMRSPEIG